jgi:putative ABC transport system permease protein
MGIPVQRGRAFEDTDRVRGVVILSRTAAARFWPGSDPVGSRVRLGSSDWLTVVGVAGDARYGALDDPEESLRPMMYLPHWQLPERPLTFVVRANVVPASLTDSLRRTLSDRQGFRVGRVETITAMVRQASASQRFSMGLVAAFAGSAVVLAVVGLYGLLALTSGDGRRRSPCGLRWGQSRGMWCE